MRIVGYRFNGSSYSIIGANCSFYDWEKELEIASIEIKENDIDGDIVLNDEYLHLICKTIGANLMGISFDEYNEICEKYGIDGQELNPVDWSEFVEADEFGRPIDDEDGFKDDGE